MKDNTHPKKDINPVHDDIEPVLQEIQQKYWQYPLAVSVMQDGPLTVHELPARKAILRSFNVDNSTPQQLVGTDLRRKNLILWTETSGVYIGARPEDAAQHTGIHMPTNSTCTFAHTEGMWIISDSSTAALVSIVVELWAD